MAGIAALFLLCLVGFMVLYAVGDQFNRIRYTSSMKRLNRRSWARVGRPIFRIAISSPTFAVAAFRGPDSGCFRP
jgi:hypothetical protein